MSTDVYLPLAIEEIEIGARRRDINQAAVKRLADSIKEVGLRHPITVRERGGKYELIAGAHRIEAHKRLGRDFVPACIVKMSNDDARLWGIAENLHRADLSKLERDEQVAEWIKITDRLSSQLAKKETGGRPEGGINAAARELGIEKDEAYRAVKVASLSDDAKEAAREAGLDDNRSALLEAASKPTVAEQVAAIHQRLASRSIQRPADDPLSDIDADERQVAALMAAWNKSSAAARQEFLLRIGH